MNDATVVVSGASAGVGRALAEAFGRRDCRVGLIARDPARLAQAAASIEALGGRAMALPLDVACAPAVEAAAECVERAFGPIDVWVNSAMATVYAPVHEMAPEEYARVTAVTYLGTIHGTLAAFKRMRPRNFGRIIQVGSALAYRGIPLQSAYCGAKFAIRGFTDSLRSELIHDGVAGVRLCMAQVPAVNTPQFDWARNRTGRRPRPIPPVFQPEAVAEAIVEQVQGCPRELWVGWPSVKAIAGSMAAPRLADRLAAGAWEGELSDQPDEAGRADNLYAPVPGEFAAHGRFDGESRQRVRAYSERAVRGLAAAGLAALAIGLGAAARRQRVGTRR